MLLEMLQNPVSWLVHIPLLVYVSRSSFFHKFVSIKVLLSWIEDRQVESIIVVWDFERQLAS